MTLFRVKESEMLFEDLRYLKKPKHKVCEANGTKTT